jgi:hypothetical protein
VQQHKLALVEKVTLIGVEIIDGWIFFSKPMTHETKALEITIGPHSSKVMFNVISSPNNPIIILSWFFFG